MDHLQIHKVLSGDPDAFRYFIKKYNKMAFAVAVSIVKDQQAAEECVQDAFFKAYKSLKNFQKESKFGSWLYTIVKNEALYYLKKQSKHTIDFLPEMNEDLADESQLLTLEKYQQNQLIHTALRQLPAQEHQMLYMFYLEQMSIKEISKFTGKSENNIKVLLHRGRKHMLTLINRSTQL